MVKASKNKDDLYSRVLILYGVLRAFIMGYIVMLSDSHPAVRIICTLNHLPSIFL
jgi:hypothetical protein